jgi:O-antigen/teichoic acid export membrane protein
MSTIKKLAGQTAVYGLSSILGRLLNYLLVPIYTLDGNYDPAEYGVISIFYAYVAFIVVLLMFGMETTFFRFINKSKDKEKTFNQAFTIVLITNVIFLAFILLFAQEVANSIGFPDMSTYVIWFAFILVFDACSSLFMAKLRYLEKPKEFAIIQLSSIGVNIVFNLIFIYGFLQSNKEFGIGFVFLANLFSSAVKPLMLYKYIIKIKLVWDKVVVKTMIWFAIPLLIGSFAGIVNETIDRILLRKIMLSKGEVYADTQVGIYSANYKLSILITLVIQAFRYAAEPFFFSLEKDKNKDKIYSKVMTYFVILISLIFLVISLNLDIFKWFIPNEKFHAGITVVPILLIANVFLGIYYNQSIWYKLADKTKYGAYIALIGAVITIGLNLYLIPIMGYMGSAWATLACYMSMTFISYYLGQKHYPIKYNLRKIGLFFGSAIVLFFIGKLLTFNSFWLTFAIHSVLILFYIGLVQVVEHPLKEFRKSK